MCPDANMITDLIMAVAGASKRAGSERRSCQPSVTDQQSPASPTLADQWSRLYDLIAAGFICLLKDQYR